MNSQDHLSIALRVLALTENGVPAPKRGHHAKIEEAVQALRRAGRFPPNLRPVVRDRLVIDWLRTHGYAGDMPSPSALSRYFAGGRHG
jgi:hypothetical protein